MTPQFAHISLVGRLRPSLALLFASAILVGACDNSSGPRTGKLSVTVAGLPTGAQAQITLLGPGNFSRVVTTTEVIANLKPGDYRVAATSVLSGLTRYSPVADTQSVTITKSNTPVEASVSYTVSSNPGPPSKRWTSIAASVI